MSCCRFDRNARAGAIRVSTEIGPRSTLGRPRYFSRLTERLLGVTWAGRLAMGDITDRQRAGEVLHQIEERFRRLVEVMPVAVYVCDASGILQSYNRRAVELWGREPELGHPAQRYCGSLRLYGPDGTLVPHQDSKMAEVLRTGIEAR